MGHEVVGRAIKVGSQVTQIQPGDRIGLGAQASSCLQPDCPQCSTGHENYCPHMVNAYAMPYPEHQGGGISYGGYADYVRAPAHFCIRIPDALASTDAAPMLCAGITVFSPLRRYGAGPATRVGIVGVGGLGHFGILFAAALGACEVVAISRTSAKRADALAMGATGFVATDEDPRWPDTHRASLDLIVCTVSDPRMPLNGYLALLAHGAIFVQVGSPEGDLPSFSPFAFITKDAKLAGSCIGPPWEIEEMLRFAAEKNVKPWIQLRSLKDANQVVVDMEKGRARYRYVLVNEKHANA